MKVRCDKCDREFTDDPNPHPGKVYMHHGKPICEDCLVDMGITPDTADPTKTYIYARTELYHQP